MVLGGSDVGGCADGARIATLVEEAAFAGSSSVDKGAVGMRLVSEGWDVQGAAGGEIDDGRGRDGEEERITSDEGGGRRGDEVFDGGIGR